LVNRLGCLFIQRARRLFAPMLTLAFSAVLAAQSLISVDDLRRHFSAQYKNEVVSVRGWVSTEKRVTSSSFKGFYLKDRYGSLVLIRTTSSLPDITSELLVTGVATQDADTGDIYLAETKRALVGKDADEVARRQQQQQEIEAAQQRAKRRRLPASGTDNAFR
jgi:hypothetical protein